MKVAVAPTEGGMDLMAALEASMAATDRLVEASVAAIVEESKYPTICRRSVQPAARIRTLSKRSTRRHTERQRSSMLGARPLLAACSPPHRSLCLRLE